MKLLLIILQKAVCTILHNIILKGDFSLNVYFISFGCKVNSYETDCLKEDFKQKGFLISDTEKADVVLINSCTVTSSGDKKTMQTLRRIRKENPNSVVVLTGCFPQAFKEEAAKIKEADIITGTKNRHEIIDLVIDELNNRNQKIVSIGDYSQEDKFELLSPYSFENKTRAFVKIQDGCNQFCTYCIIPYSRGRIRSKSISELKFEVENLVKKGFMEIVLVGINLAFYGLEYNLKLIDAVKTCSKIDGVKRIRLGSLEPEEISDNDLLELSNLDNFCPQFHLSLQSGCDKTLKNMNRKYNTDQFAKLVTKIRTIFINPSITTDIMVGFPGETDEDFDESLEFARKISFSKMHVFPYSIRTGTVAATMKNQIPENIKKIRAKKMNDLAQVLHTEFLKSQIDKTVTVLFEKEDCTDFHHGYSPNYTLVKILRDNTINSLRNKIFYVKINSCNNDYCIGKIIDN